MHILCTDLLSWVPNTQRIEKFTNLYPVSALLSILQVYVIMEVYNKYAALADTTKIEDITSNEVNRDILHRLKNNDEDFDQLWVYEEEELDQRDYNEYSPDSREDIGWLGYFIGNNTNVEELNLFHPIGVDKTMFYKGLSNNRYIQKILFSCSGMELNWGTFQLLAPFFKYNDSLIEVNLHDCQFLAEDAHAFSQMLGEFNKSLESFTFVYNQIDSESLVGVIVALSTHRQWKRLEFTGVNIGRNECTALSTLLRYNTTTIQKLGLPHDYINDEEIEVLVNDFFHMNQLQELNLGCNTLITIKGWRAVATLLELPHTKLETLNIYNNNIGNDGALVFANALGSNSTLKTLGLRDNGITAEGWAPFSKLLCDTSSVNNTYMSNHTLQSFGHNVQAVPGEVISYQTLNGGEDQTISGNRRTEQQKVATRKILQNHSHFNMRPFFEWEFKVLPIMMRWFDRSYDCVAVSLSNRVLVKAAFALEKKIQRLELSVTFDFIKEFPMLYIESVTRKEIAEYTTIEEELLQGGLDAEQEVRLEEIWQSKARAMRRLGMK